MNNIKLATLLLAFLMCGSVCFAQNTNTNVTVIVNPNKKTPQPQEKEPQPQRKARKIQTPVKLQGYLWVYTEDLGHFSSVPTETIEQINRQQKYGRDTWRVPTSEELGLMINEADKVGLGPLDSYMYVGKRYGRLRLVSTGPSVAERKREEDEERRRQKADEEARRKQQQADEDARRKQQQAEERRQQEIADSIENQLKQEQEAAISSGQAFGFGNTLWQARNKDAKRATDPGSVTNNPELPTGWRLPTVKEFKSLIKNAKENSSGFRYGNYTIPHGIYLVDDNGTIKIYNTKLDMVLDGKSGLVRAVQDMR